MKQYTLNEFTKELSTNSKNLFEFVYREYYPGIRQFVRKNKGTEQDAKDVFQEAILAVIRNIEEHSVNGKVLLYSYLFSVSRYIWMHNLRRPGYQELSEEHLVDNYGLSEAETVSVENSLETGIFQRNFRKLDKLCQKLLKQLLKEKSLKDIAKKLGLKTENTARQRKFYCKEKLIQLIKKDPEYKAFIKDRENHK